MDRPSCRAVVGRAASASLSKRALAVLPVERLRSEALPKQLRLAKRREFLSVYESGQKHFSRYSVLFTAPNDLPYSRIGVTATKKLGKANIRNRLKRWTREVYRRQREPLGIDARSLDIVVNVKPNAAGSTFQDFSRDLTRSLERIVTDAARRAQPVHPQS
jgi:ribonuclease P protein component